MKISPLHAFLLSYQVVEKKRIDILQENEKTFLKRNV